MTIDSYVAKLREKYGDFAYRLDTDLMLWVVSRHGRRTDLEGKGKTIGEAITKLVELEREKL